MSETEGSSPIDQLNEKMVDLRNEAIVQAANVYLLGRQAALAGVGIAFLAVDSAQAILERAVERGEIAEADAQKVIDGLRQRAIDRAQAADQARVEVTEKASAALTENVKSILSILKVPGLKVTATQAAVEVEIEQTDRVDDPGAARADGAESEEGAA